MKNSKKSASLSEEERQIIFRKKLELNQMEVPRKEWARIIQGEITNFRKQQQKKTRKNQDLGKLGNAFRSTWRKLKKIFLKILTKRALKGQSGVSDEMLDQMLEMATEGKDPNDIYARMFSGMQTSMNSNAREESLIFTGETSQNRKKMIVTFDDDAEDDEDDEEREN